MKYRESLGLPMIEMCRVLLFLLALTAANVNAENYKELTMKIESPAFKHGQPIPKKYTCSGQDVSPPLAFQGAPKETKTFALIVDDPDAPMGTFDHWIAWNIPGNTTDLPEGAQIPNQGKNGYREARYRGPCPPPGAPHRYFFKLYALDSTIDLPNGSSKKQLEGAIEGHVLGQSELVGTFQR